MQITDRQFGKLLAKKHRLQDEFEKIANRRRRLLEQIESLDDDMSGVAKSIYDVTLVMLDTERI